MDKIGCGEKLPDKVYGHLYFEKTANPVVELDVPGFFCHHNGKSPEGLTNITTGDRCPEGKGTRGRAPTTAAPEGRHLKTPVSTDNGGKRPSPHVAH